MIRRTVLAGLAATLILAVVVGTTLAMRPVWVFTTQLTGEAERPAAGDSDAHGSATVRLYPDTDTVCWVVTWNHIDGTIVAAHIHGPVGTDEPGPVVVPFFMGTSFDANGMHRGCATAASSLVDDIIDRPHMYYVNVHSLPSFGPGAVRGQLD